jgi:hypothetical protein
MPRFYKEAILAAHCAEGTMTATDIGALETWPEVVEALNELGPAARCHAIYADWLLQLDEPGGDVQIQIRDLLLGQGALAANYLGEMAQNADDSGASSLLVALEGDWLLVANNGRALSSLNLLGLCRFFVHSNGQVVGLTPETIGKFGIGFKSCHRVADEVFVWSWRTQEEYGFRLPICQGGGEIAKPDPAKLALLLDYLKKAGKPLANVRPDVQLGHCTPEALEGRTEALPAALVQRIEGFKGSHSEKGVWFALHLHERGRKEAEKRIMEQADALYELCPLFLNHLRNVTLQDRSLRLVLGNPIGQNVGDTEARRITLEVTNSDGTKRNDRLLLLSSSADKTWKLSLPADSEFKIKRPTADQFSLRSGGGYAFLPLPSLNWPWHVHFHLNAPTNLARSDWNPADAEETHAHIRDASAKLAGWTSSNANLWHPTWQPADILTKDPSDFAPDSSARVFADAYQESLCATDSLRTLWGAFTSPENAVGLRLEPGQVVTDAWLKIAEFVPAAVQQQYPLVLLDGGAVHLDLPMLTTEKAKRVFTALRETNHDAPFWQAYVQAVLGTDAVVSGGYSRSEMIENALGPVPLNRPTDACITIETAAESRFAVRLTDEWHERFRRMSSNWLGPNWSLASQTVFRIHVSQMLSSLSAAAETPTGWDEVSRMREEDFRQAGDAFWSAQRPACPPALTDAVIRAIWVESGHGWVPMAEVWLGGEPIAMLKGVVRALERRPGEWKDQRRDRMSDALARWALKKNYDETIEGRIEELAENEFYRRLKEDNPANPNRLGILVLANNWKTQNLPPSWRETVVDAAKEAVTRLFKDAGCDGWRGKALLVGGGTTSKVVSWLPDYVEAPAWLEADAIRWIEDQGLLRNLNLSHKLLNGTNRDQKAELGRELLAGFRHWPQPPFEGAHVTAMRELFLDATGTWTVGYPGGADKRLNEHCAWIQPTTPAGATECVDCVLAGAANRELDGGSFLPDALEEVPELRNKCVQVADLKHEVISPDEDEASVLIEAEIPEAISQNTWFKRLRQLRPNAKVVSLAGHQRLKWRRGSMELTVSNAEFGLCQFQGAEAIFIADLTRQVVREDGSRYREVLYAYKSVAPDDKIIARALNNNRNLAKVYRENRPMIIARLVQAHATEMGYEAKHVMRELLQNAESAYASRQPDYLPGRRTFEIGAKPIDKGAVWNVEVVHYGRAFNEPDKDGRVRDNDIARLCALAAPQNYSKEEVGKFNRGFKAVFQVTDEVHVTSGGYDFKIEDMLLLNPPEPAHEPSATDKSTRFAFKVEASKKIELLRDNNHGKPKPFKAIELVFLRYVDAVIIKLSGRAEKTFELERDVNGGEWNKLTISEHEDAKQDGVSHYLLCQQRDASNQRVAVAIMLSANGLPIQAPKDQRFLYRTFPLQQPSDWFPFLINADFITEKGRAGLLPMAENDALIIRALEMSLALVRTRIIETGGSIPSWVAWVSVLDRRKLEEGATTVTTCRSSFESALRSFDVWLFNQLPDGQQLRPASEFVFPSRLMRGIQDNEHFAEALEINAASWIDVEVAEALQPFGVLSGRSLQLREQVALLIQKGHDKEELNQIIEQLQSQEFAKNAAPYEIEAALGLLARQQVIEYQEMFNLLPDGYSEEAVDDEIIQDLDVHLVYAAWNESEALSQFTLAGWMGNLVFPELGNVTDQDQANLLRRTQKKESKGAWHRLFCLGSLLGARAKPTTVRNFWEGSLASRGIFDESGGSQQLAAILDEISHKPFRDLDATGENAELWRRVFYDFQKIRLYILEDDLAGAFMEQLQHVQEWDGAINFLKNGFRKGERRWTCAVGQSMTAPLFWIMRELRRIHFIERDTFDASCLYVNGPVRRVAARLGWINPEDCRAYNFEHLLRLSHTCHQGSGQLQGFYDLPLQWYASQSPG